MWPTTSPSLPTPSTSSNVAGPNAAAADLGFSFNVVTRTSDSNTQGTLRRFLNNAKTVTGPNPMRFVPAVPVTIDLDATPGNGDEWWQVTLGAILPDLTDANTTVDGTAYDLTDGLTVLDTNAGQGGNPDFPGKWVGTGANGVVEDGGDDPTLPTYLNPELEVDGNDVGMVFDIAASNTIVRRVSIYNSAPGVEGVLVSAGTGSLLTDSYVGVRADSTQPLLADQIGTHGIEVIGGAADVTNNYFAYTGDGAIILDNASLVQGNDIYLTGTVGTGNDGISLELSDPGETIVVRENRVDLSNAYGLEGWGGPGGWTIEDNTFSRSGRGVHVEGGGARLFGIGSTFVHNRVVDSRDAGLVLAERSAPGSNKYNLISAELLQRQRHHCDRPGSDQHWRSSTRTGMGSPPTRVRRPLVATPSIGQTRASTSRSSRVPPMAAPRPRWLGPPVRGQPSRSIGLPRTGSPTTPIRSVEPVPTTARARPTSDSAVADGSGNWTYVDAALNTSDVISTIAIDATTNTSEFSANATVRCRPEHLRQVVFEDIVGDVLNDGVIGDVLNPGVVGVTVRLYRDTNANGLPDGADTLVSTQVTGAGGAYIFTGLPNGHLLGRRRLDDGFSGGRRSTPVTRRRRLAAPSRPMDPIAAWCADGLGATAERAGGGTVLRRTQRCHRRQCGQPRRRQNTSAGPSLPARP